MDDSRSRRVCVLGCHLLALGGFVEKVLIREDAQGPFAGEVQLDVGMPCLASADASCWLTVSRTATRLGTGQAPHPGNAGVECGALDFPRGRGG